MPHSKSAQKRMRDAEKRRARNKSVRSQTKTNVTKAEKLIFSGELETGKEAVVTAISSLDKAAEKGIIHPNNAARRKSRLMKKLNQAQVLSSAETEPEESAETEQTEQYSSYYYDYQLSDENGLVTFNVTFDWDIIVNHTKIFAESIFSGGSYTFDELEDYRLYIRVWHAPVGDASEMAMNNVQESICI